MHNHKYSVYDPLTRKALNETGDMRLLTSLDVGGNENHLTDELNDNWCPDEITTFCGPVYRFQTESLCGEARDSPRPIACSSGSCESNCPPHGSSGDQSYPPTAASSSAQHHQHFPVLLSSAPVPSSEMATCPASGTFSSTSSYGIDPEDDELQKALRLSLEYESDDVPRTELPSGFSHQQQPPPTRVVGPSLITVPTPAARVMGGVDSVTSYEAMRSIGQRVLNEEYANQHGETTRWVDLLLPEHPKKENRMDSVECLIGLIKELPTVLISTLTLSPRPPSWDRSESSSVPAALPPTSAATVQGQREPETTPELLLEMGWSPNILSASDDQGRESFDQAWTLIFGQQPMMITWHDFYGWWCSFFQFNTTNPSVTLGLLQDHGGPCGVLASLQCWMFLHAILLRPVLIPSFGFHQHQREEGGGEEEEDADEAATTRSTASFSTVCPISESDDGDGDLLWNEDHPSPPQRVFFHRVTKPLSTPLRRYTCSHDGWCPNYNRTIQPHAATTAVDGILSSIRSSSNHRTNGLLSSPSSSSSASGVSSLLTQIFSPCTCISVSSLLWAICTVLYRSTPNSLYTVACLTSTCPGLVNGPMREKESLFGIKDRINYRLYRMTSIQQVYAFYAKFNSQLLLSRGSILGIMFSVILTRGPDQVRCDVDDPLVPLIGLFGHSSQELVNLFLSGRGVTNVFDGIRTIGSSASSSSVSLPEQPLPVLPVPFKEPEVGLQLRGISRPQIIGYLTELEALRYCEVGKYYKNPASPIWVVGSANHFTSIVSLDPRVSRIHSSEKLLMFLTRAFSELDPTQSGILGSSELVPLLRSTGLLDYKVEAKKILDQDGVILKMDFISWATPLRAAMASKHATRHPQGFPSFFPSPPQQPEEQQQQEISLDPPTKFVLYHYNGQGAGGPTLTRLLVEPIDQANIQDEDGTGLGIVLRTRWLNSLVTGIP